MKLIVAIVFATVLAGQATPVSRVVQLLTGLRTKLDADAKAEKDIFERFECWYKTIINSKTASNSAAQSRIDSLNQYVADIEAGKIEFTTERADLENQVAGLRRDIETAKALRQKEEADFKAAEEEMEQAIAALGQAIEAIEKGTSFAQTDAQTEQGPQLLNVKWSLRRVLAFGRGILSAKDAKFLEHALDGDVPNPDWKKLNRKATFKKQYSARSGKIQEVLKKMEVTFKENLDAARSKEEQSKKSYAALMEAKEAMLKTAEDALVELVEENGARGLSKQEALDEVANLGDQMTADKKFMEQTETTFQEKSKEFEERRQLRMDEIKMIGEAISVLHSDDARDAFTKSYSLLQVSRSTGVTSSVSRAVKELWSLAASTHSSHLALLATVATAGARFDKVIEMVDKLVAQLQAEEKTDLEKKEGCEKDLAENTRQSQVESRNIDGLTDDIEKAQATVESVAAQIAEQEKTIQELQESIDSLTRQREDENKQFMQDLADDEKAVELISSAIALIKKFYTDNKLALIGVHSSTVLSKAQQRQPIVEAGKAPPPPPATWATPSYGGSVDEQAGIQGILSILKEDIEKDITSAKAAEEESKTAYGKQKADLETAIEAGNAAITDYEKQKADAEQLVEDKKAEKISAKANLVEIVKELKSLQQGCDFFVVNFAERAKKRQIEIDGLKQAKAILSSSNAL